MSAEPLALQVAYETLARRGCDAAVTGVRDAAGVMIDYHHVAVAASTALHLTVMLALLWPVAPERPKGNSLRSPR